MQKDWKDNITDIMTGPQRLEIWYNFNEKWTNFISNDTYVPISLPFTHSFGND